MDSSKSMLDEVRLLYDAIFLDLVNMHPSIRSDLERDFTRLLNAEADVGLPFYTIALPAGCKWFEESLSAGRLKELRPPHFGVKSKVDKRPKLCYGLISQIFEPDGTLRLAFDPSYVQSVRQVLLALKKLDMECEERYTNESVRKFHEIETSLPRPWEGTWSSDTPSWALRSGHPIWGDCAELNGQTHLFDAADPLLQLDSQYNWEGLRRFSASVLYQFGQFDPYEIRPKHGPGAVSDRLESYVKYDFAYWSERLECVFPYDWHASGRFAVPDYVRYEEFASQMHAVPKTQSGPRLIAAEPTPHQWIQQGIRYWLETRCKNSILKDSIDFRSQETSRQMALAASYDGQLATVDLSSASDRLSCRLVEFLFQRNRQLLDGLHACRTRAMRDIHGELVLLRKFATQGSAVIFPLQSIVYAILALWAVGLARGKANWRELRELAPLVRVFGDDIIVPVDVYPVLKGLLETLLLKVNTTKSHATGYFRESCGMDAYAGIDVTPAYLRKFYSSTPESLVSIVEASNNFHKKGYWHTAKYLEQTVPWAERKLIPIGTTLGAVGLFSYCGVSTDHLRKRYNRDLHREEVKLIDVEIKPTLVQGDGEGPHFVRLT